MPDPQQYDTSQLDEVQHPTLGTLKFPRQMPFEERNQHIDEMLKAKPPARTEAAKPPAEKSFWQRGWEGLNQHLPGSYREAGEEGGSASAGLSELGGMARESADKQQQENLHKVATTGEKPSLWNRATHYLKNTLGSSLDAASGATSPTGLAMAGGMAFAPEVTGPLLSAHGLATAFKHAKGAVQGNPDEAEQALGGAAEAAGGAAGTTGAYKGGAAESNVVKMGKAGVRSVRETFGHELTPQEASTPRPEGAFQPARASTPKEALDHATQEGINLTPFQASESKVAGKLQVAGEHGIVGGQSLETAMNAERAKFGEAVNKFSERVDPTRLGLSEEAAGEAIKQAAGTAKSVAHDNAANGYKKIDYFMQEKVDPAPITKKWVDVRESLPMGVEEQIKAQVPRNLRAVVEDMLSAKPDGFKPTVEQAIKLRSFFREMGEAEGLPNSHQAAFRQLEGAADSAIESTGKKVGAVDDWREANAGWKDYTGKYGDKQSPLYKILKQADPAKITRDLMTRGSASDIEILRKEGMTSALEPLRRQVIQDIARNKFTVGRDGLGGYSDSFLRQLFGPGGQKELYLKSDLARRMNWEPNPSGSGGQLLVGEQLGKPSKVAQLFGAAKMSMPKPAQSFLPQGTPTPFKLNPKMLPAAFTAAKREMQP